MIPLVIFGLWVTAMNVHGAKKICLRLLYFHLVVKTQYFSLVLFGVSSLSTSPFARIHVTLEDIVRFCLKTDWLLQFSQVDAPSTTLLHLFSTAFLRAVCVGCLEVCDWQRGKREEIIPLNKLLLRIPKVTSAHQIHFYRFLARSIKNWRWGVWPPQRGTSQALIWVNHPGILLKSTFWLSRSRAYISNKLMG